MTRMGEPWLRYLYTSYLQDPRGVSIVALSRSGDIVGFAVGGDCAILQSFRKSAKRRFIVRLMWKSLADSVIRRAVTASVRTAIRGEQGDHDGARDDNVGNLLSIGVLRSEAGTGAAVAMLGLFERVCWQAGFDMLQLSVLEANGRARHFYEKCGWTFMAESHGSLVRYSKMRETHRIEG